MEAKKKRQQFSKEFRANLVKLVIDGGRKASDVAVEHGVPVTSVYAWVRQARVDAGDLESKEGTTDAKAENARLRKRNKELEQQLAFAKKTAVFFATQKRRDSLL
jgi:transposase